LNFTEIARREEAGEEKAREELIRSSYEELRRMAAIRMAGERNDHTLTSTALVHEVSIKLPTESSQSVRSRTHFLAYASTAMRHFLSDFARTKERQKRGAGEVLSR
jgi:RNA polymerase sigma factor (TIGR02999 family)